MVKKYKVVWRVVYGKDKPYYILNKKKQYVKNKDSIKQFGNSKQIKVLTKNLKSKTW